MNDSFLIHDAKLRGRSGLWDLVIRGGKYVSITAASQPLPPCRQSFDANGHLVTEQFCENHIHLDYAHTAGESRDNSSGTLFEAIEIWRERKEQGLHVFVDIKRNAIEAAKQCVKHGVGFIRTHVDVTDPTLVALKALLEVKEEIKGWCELQIVAFPQNGLYTKKYNDGFITRAIELGADVLGAIPHLEPCYEDGVRSVKFILAQAEKHNLMVDIHCDEIDDPSSRFIDVVAAETTKRGLQGRVTVSHAVAMGFYPAGYIARLLPKLKAAGVGFAIAPRENLQLQGRGFEPVVPRGMAPVRSIVDAGIRVAFCQDSICDPWYPLGDGNPIRNMDTGMHVAHMLTAKYMDRCLDFVTVDPATNMGLNDVYGIKEGLPANCLVLDAEWDREVLRLLPPVLLSIHNGREVFRRPEAPVQWSLGETDDMLGGIDPSDSWSVTTVS